MLLLGLTQPIAEIRICSSLGDLHESLLNELCRSCHGIRIDLDVRQQVLVSPAMGLCGRAAKLNLHAALLQIGNEILVGVARRDVAICVVRRVVQSHMPAFVWKTATISEAALQPAMSFLMSCMWKIEAGRSTSNAKAQMLNTTFTSDSLTGMSMCSGFSGVLMMDSLSRPILPLCSSAWRWGVMSALPPKADIESLPRYVRFVPKADKRTAANWHRSQQHFCSF